PPWRRDVEFSHGVIRTTPGRRPLIDEDESDCYAVDFDHIRPSRRLSPIVLEIRIDLFDHGKCAELVEVIVELGAHRRLIFDICTSDDLRGHASIETRDSLIAAIERPSVALLGQCTSNAILRKYRLHYSRRPEFGQRSVDLIKQNYAILAGSDAH